MTPAATSQPNFAELLATVTKEPGTISAAYTAFHNYSFGNMLLAAGQCQARGIPLGPLATFQRWKELGRYVAKGSKAIELCMPITCKRKAESVEPGDDGSATFTRFVYKRNWFVLAQTEGEPYQGPAPAEWDKARALAALDVTEIPFEHMNGNVQGFARARSVAISPLATEPFKTLFHEIAHVIIGHTSEGELRDDERTPRNIRELEAEATAMLCCAALGLPGVEDSRGYVQAWFGAGSEVPDASARRIFKAADSILKAGRAAEATT